MPNPESSLSAPFHVGDILSITTGYLVSPNGMEGVEKILDFMTGDTLFTHQLPRARVECIDSLIAQHPDLDFEINEDLTNPATFEIFMQNVIEKYGETRTITPLAVEDHTHINPVEELCDMVGSEKVLVFDAANIDDEDAVENLAKEVKRSEVIDLLLDILEKPSS